MRTNEDTLSTNIAAYPKPFAMKNPNPYPIGNSSLVNTAKLKPKKTKKTPRPSEPKNPGWRLVKFEDLLPIDEAEIAAVMQLLEKFTEHVRDDIWKVGDVEGRWRTVHGRRTFFPTSGGKPFPERPYMKSKKVKAAEAKEAEKARVKGEKDKAKSAERDTKTSEKTKATNWKNAESLAKEAERTMKSGVSRKVKAHLSAFVAAVKSRDEGAVKKASSDLAKAVGRH